MKGLYWKFCLTIIGVLLFMALLSCNQSKGRQVTRGFYFWKTSLKITDYEKAQLNNLKTQQLYVRFFDVDIAADGKSAKPLAILKVGDTLPKFDIVPVVFITPRALETMNHNNVDFYARNIALLLHEKAKEMQCNPKEIQIDCDWTKTNKALYFAFLEQLKLQPFLKDKILSATIRLHQIKYRLAAGVPPVDKGLLMAYNIAKIDDFNVENSILAESEAKQYLGTISTYPLHLDVALPVFSWTLLFDNKKLKGVIRGMDEAILQNTDLFTSLGKHKYAVKKDALLNGYDLKVGQILRFENSDVKTVQNIANYLSEQLKSDSLHLLLYHCDSLNLSKYSTHELEKVFSSFD